MHYDESDEYDDDDSDFGQIALDILTLMLFGAGVLVWIVGLLAATFSNDSLYILKGCIGLVISVFLGVFIPAVIEDYWSNDAYIEPIARTHEAINEEDPRE